MDGGIGDDEAVKMKLLTWNVHYTNKDTVGIAEVVKESSPDIVGLCEFTANVAAMATDLSAATGRNFKIQPGRDSWQGYGTDIFYDDGLWEALEGGVKKVSCAGTQGGDRAANWAVLKSRTAAARTVITGGVHLSYCDGGCDSTHECELRETYSNFEAMQKKYPDAAVIWMGDLNRGVETRIMQNLFEGKIGDIPPKTFAVEDLAMTEGNTYYTGGNAIDHILGEVGKFQRLEGGKTGQGVTGQHLSGADHFPVRALVLYK